MAQYNILIKEEEMQLLIAQYLAEHNLYRSLYVFKQESESQAPIYNRQIDLLNQYFVEGAYDDILKFLVQIPQSEEMFQLMFKVTQLELLTFKGNDATYARIEGELREYFPLVAANELEKYNQRLQAFNEETKREFESEVFQDLQHVLIPYYNEFEGSECVFTQLPGHRLKDIIEKYYNKEFEALSLKEKPKLKNVPINLFEDVLSQEQSVLPTEECKQGEEIDVKEPIAAQHDAKNKNATSQEIPADDAEQQPQEEAPRKVDEEAQNTAECQPLASSISRPLNGNQHISVLQAEQKLLRSQYYLLEYSYNGENFEADVAEFIKYEGLYRIMFSTNGAKTQRHYNLPFDADQVLLTENKAFMLAISYSMEEVAVFDINFHDAISIKDFSDIIGEMLIDCAIFDQALFILTKDEAFAIDLVDFSVISSLRLQLLPSEKMQYFFMGKIPVIFTGKRSLFLSLQHEELRISQDFVCKYGDCAVIGSNALLCNSGSKLYGIDMLAKNKVELSFNAAKLIQFTEYSVFGITTNNHIFSYHYKTNQFLISPSSIGNEEIVYFEVIGANLFWVSESGLFGNDRLSQFLM